MTSLVADRALCSFAWQLTSSTHVSLLQSHGDVDVMRFGLEDGWDFSKASHRKQLLRLADDLEPDEIFMSPKCTLWSRM